MHAFRDVATAAYCPRKLYYRQRQPDEQNTPDGVERRRELAFQYERLLADDELLRAAPIAVSPAVLNRC
jgi:CRISPR-associated exonuclease Cas4